MHRMANIQKSLMISLRDVPSMSFNFWKPRLCSAPGSQANVSIAEWPVKQSLASLSQGKTEGMRCLLVLMNGTL
jgi:hypothetical protein